MFPSFDFLEEDRREKRKEGREKIEGKKRVRDEAALEREKE